MINVFRVFFLAFLIARHGFPSASKPRGTLGRLQMEVVYPIHVAAQLNDTLILRQLLELGVDPQTGAAEGRTAMDFAEEANSNGDSES